MPSNLFENVYVLYCGKRNDIIFQNTLMHITSTLKTGKELYCLYLTMINQSKFIQYLLVSKSLIKWQPFKQEWNLDSNIQYWFVEKTGHYALSRVS